MKYARLPVGSAAATLVATAAAWGLFRSMGGVSQYDQTALILLILGLPLLVALLAPIAADQGDTHPSQGSSVWRWIGWSVGIAINYSCVCGLFVAGVWGETIRIGAFWFTWSSLIGASIGMAFAIWYGRRRHYSLPKSRVRGRVVKTISIASTIVSAMVLVPIGVLVVATWFAALGNSAGSR